MSEVDEDKTKEDQPPEEEPLNLDEKTKTDDEQELDTLCMDAH